MGGAMSTKWPSAPKGFEMSALGHEQTSRHVRVMSVIPFKADIHQHGLHVRLVPIADFDMPSGMDGVDDNTRGRYGRSRQHPAGRRSQCTDLSQAMIFQ